MTENLQLVLIIQTERSCYCYPALIVKDKVVFVWLGYSFWLAFLIYRFIFWYYAHIWSIATVTVIWERLKVFGLTGCEYVQQATVFHWFVTAFSVYKKKTFRWLAQYHCFNHFLLMMIDTWLTVEFSSQHFSVLSVWKENYVFLSLSSKMMFKTCNLLVYEYVILNSISMELKQK